jgi:N-acetylneuraminate synthase
MKPFIIAEIGLNHNGNLDLAKKLIDMAKDCGCDAVKFQKRTINIVYTEEFLKEHRESPWGDTQRDQKEGLEFGEKEYDQIDKYCKEKGIDWFASAWDEESFQFLRKYNLKYNKIASAMLTNFDFCSLVAGAGKHTFISTGMTEMKTIVKVVEMFKRSGTSFTLMHSVSLYPCPDALVNIRAIKTLRDRFKCAVGYSGHEVGILPSVLAVMMGAEAIERHITLDRASYGSDQSASLEKRGLEYLVRDCRDVESMMGTGEKIVLPEEEEIAKKLRWFEREPESHNVVRMTSVHR